VLDRLVISDEPSIRLKARTAVLGERAAPHSVEEVRSSARVAALLSNREADGTVPFHPYAKWRGAHWLLTVLAELGYPPDDESLVPLREQVLAWLLSDGYEKRWTPRRHGLCRLHASQDANAVWYLLRLHLADDRVERLTERLLDAQWPDGGWNCDPTPSAHVSSFEETLIPLRALALFAAETSSSKARQAADRAAEIFLSRRLYRRRSDDRPIADRFLQLAFPPYWHYDVLFGLKVLAEAGYIHDERCGDALDLLEVKRLPDGGFPAEARYYRGPTARSNASPVDWGGTSRHRSNEWVTVDALAVLAASDRLNASARAGPLPPSP
jgi:hypothetical protein